MFRFLLIRLRFGAAGRRDSIHITFVPPCGAFLWGWFIKCALVGDGGFYYVEGGCCHFYLISLGCLIVRYSIQGDFI